MFSDFIGSMYNGLSALLLTLLVGLLLTVLLMFVVDVSQSRNAVRRNYPVIGRFRGLFEHLGTFFRQYFFAMDREEMPFNRALRDWVYRAAKNKDSTIPFGSTRDVSPVGSISFVNCPYPTLDTDAVPARSIVIGPDCPHPFEAGSLFNISGIMGWSVPLPYGIAMCQNRRVR